MVNEQGSRVNGQGQSLCGEVRRFVWGRRMRKAQPWLRLFFSLYLL